MALYPLCPNTGEQTVHRTENFPEGQRPPVLAPAKGVRWLPVMEVGKRQSGADEVAEWSWQITETEARQVWAYRPHTPDEIAAFRTTALDRIDREAEQRRLRHITPGAGQALSYAMKAEGARAILAGATSAPILEPLIGVEIDPATGQPCATLQDVARVVAATADAWAVLEGRIDAARRGAKIAVEAAQSKTAIDAVFPIEWPEA